MKHKFAFNRIKKTIYNYYNYVTQSNKLFGN